MLIFLLETFFFKIREISHTYFISIIFLRNVYYYLKKNMSKFWAIQDNYRGDVSYNLLIIFTVILLFFFFLIKIYLFIKISNPCIKTPYQLKPYSAIPFIDISSLQSFPSARRGRIWRLDQSSKRRRRYSTTTTKLVNTLPLLVSLTFRYAVYTVKQTCLFSIQFASINYLFYLNICMEKAKLSERAVELLALPDDGVPRLLLDIGNLLHLL